MFSPILHHARYPERFIEVCNSSVNVHGLVDGHHGDESILAV